jgi:hypothetical protein
VASAPRSSGTKRPSPPRDGGRNGESLKGFIPGSRFQIVTF